MFGLMKLRGNDSFSDGAVNVFSRCRVCAGLAETYSNSARIYVNYDVAYFARLLDSLRHVQKQHTACECAEGCHCRAQDSQDPVMRWATATNILLAKLKADDAQQDREGWRWKLVTRHLGNITRKAEFQSFASNWNLSEITRLADEQRVREQKTFEGHFDFSPREALSFLAEPTSSITSQVVRQGAELVNPNASNLAAQIGANFARIAYIIDAVEDYSQDFKTGQFNALRSAYQLEQKLIPDKVFAEVSDLLRAEKNDVMNGLSHLPATDENKHALSSTFALNLDHKLEWLEKKQRYCNSDKIQLALDDRFARVRTYFQKIKPASGKPSMGLAFGTLGAVAAAAVMFARVKYGVDGDTLLSGSLDAPLYGVWFAAMGGVKKRYDDRYSAQARRDERCMDACCCCGWIAPECCLYSDDCCPWC